MKNTLLPCPFCGRSKNVQLETDFHPDRTKCNWSARVICLDCFGTSQTHGFEWTEEAAKNEAIAAWNRRTGKDINVATNAQRIRSMSDEELAELIYSFEDLKAPDYCQRKKECDDMLDSDIDIPAEKCIGCLLDWLRKEATDER